MTPVKSIKEVKSIQEVKHITPGSSCTSRHQEVPAEEPAWWERRRSRRRRGRGGGRQALRTGKSQTRAREACARVGRAAGGTQRTRAGHNFSRWECARGRKFRRVI